MANDENNQEVLEIMKNTIKDAIFNIWDNQDINDIENFSDFLADGLMETFEIRPIAMSQNGDTTLIEITPIPVEEVWEITDQE